MLKKTLSALLGAIVFLSFSPLSLAYVYEDVPYGSMYYYPIDYLRRNDVFKDTKNFYPDLLISRAEFIKYLVILNSPEFKPSGNVQLPFEDTRDNAWYAAYFKEAIRLGILDEREQNVQPEIKLSLIDALRLLFHSQSIPIPNVYKGANPYKDLKENSSITPLVMRALELDLMIPQADDYVGIYKRVTRGEAARMIYKLDLASLGTATSNGLPNITNYGYDLQKVISVWELLTQVYVDQSKVDTAKLADLAIRSIVDSLEDPYTTYLDEAENESFFDDIDGQIEGIGAVIGYDDNKEVVIVSPIKDSPAEKAGIKAADIVYEVDGVNVREMDLMSIVALIKGPKGTEVKLKIKRGSEYKTISVVRDIIDVHAMESSTLANGEIMLVDFYQFNQNAPEEFQAVVDQIGSNAKIRGMIIDLRDNPGGLLDAVINILGHMIPAQKNLVHIEYLDFSQVLLSRGKGELSGFPMLVLINKGSASASEILAGALQDYDLATIVGETSFGKGTVQEVNYFYDNSSLKITIAKWLTPDRQDIQDGGITPDIKVADNEATANDEQLDAAIAELRKLMQ